MYQFEVFGEVEQQNSQDVKETQSTGDAWKTPSQQRMLQVLKSPLNV